MFEPAQIIDIEHGRNMVTPLVTSLLENFTSPELLQLWSEILQRQQGDAIELNEHQRLMECLAIPTLLAEVQRRMEVAELEED